MSFRSVPLRETDCADLFAKTFQFFRKRLYDGVVNRKSKSLFDFKYVPQMGKSTRRERYGTAGAGKHPKLDLPILSSVAKLVDMGNFEMVCLMVGVMAGAVAAWGVLLMGKLALELHPTFIAPHSSVAGLA